MAKSQAVSTEVKKLTPAEFVMSREDKIVSALPAHMDRTKFMRLFSQALAQNPKLQNCSKQSLYVSVCKAAADGLMLDGHEAALVPMGAHATYRPMTFGLLKLARNSGKLLSIRAGIVYEQEWTQGLFEYEEGTAGYLRHRPMLMGDRGDPIAAYSVATLVGDIEDVCVMRRDDILHVKKSAQGTGSADSPWNSHPMEMWKKTVLRRHIKTLPLDSDVARVFERVDELYDFKRPALPAVKEAGGAAKLIAKAMTPAEVEKPAQPQEEPKQEPEDAQFNEVDEPEEI